jgi:hypothetical protein
MRMPQNSAPAPIRRRLMTQGNLRPLAAPCPGPRPDKASSRGWRAQARFAGSVFSVVDQVPRHGPAARVSSSASSQCAQSPPRYPLEHGNICAQDPKRRRHQSRGVAHGFLLRPYQLTAALRLRRPLDMRALAAALAELARRHEALRTGLAHTAASRPRRPR